MIFFFFLMQIHNLPLQSCSPRRDTSKSALEFRIGEAEHLEFRFPFQDFLLSPDHEVPPPVGVEGPSAVSVLLRKGIRLIFDTVWIRICVCTS